MVLPVRSLGSSRVSTSAAKTFKEALSSSGICGSGLAGESWALKGEDQGCAEVRKAPSSCSLSSPKPLISSVTSQQLRFAAYLSLILDRGIAGHLY